MNTNDFYRGMSFQAYEWLGAHVQEHGVVFRTFAPNAKGVVLLWNDQEIPMNRILDGNFYEVYIQDAKPGKCYEYRIYGQNGDCIDHCDPYGFGMQMRPDHKSVIRNLYNYQFQDDAWMNKRNDCREQPFNVYELHLGSWRKKGDNVTDFYRYDELADPLISYLKETGYNYVEFMPISEHPCDESWGYQNTGFFAPTSRYGTVNELKMLIDRLHQNDIGVLLDFVPVHFAIDDYGLAKYDGSALYEYPHQDVGISEWGSCNFMHSRGEVRSFLQSAANYWLKEYHFDGLRMDAISRIIYWHGDERRGVNGNAVDFIKVMNQELKLRNPGCILIAEDSTNYPDVTRNVSCGGLRFDYKWDLGWMHDTLEYFQLAPYLRVSNYHKLTFSMMYFRNEAYMLPLSHDEVVHGKAAILQKMNGQYDDKFPQARAMYAYMMVHPGKKLNFMGNEIGQLREWDEKREQDWDLRKYPLHDSFYHYMKTLNHIYLDYPALSQWDYKEEGFQWLDCSQEERRIYTILRSSQDQKIVAIFNFSDLVQENYEVTMEGVQNLQVLVYSDWECFNGETPADSKVIHYDNHRISCTLNPFSALIAVVQ